jgi:hypothetical protein
MEASGVLGCGAIAPYLVEARHELTQLLLPLAELTAPHKVHAEVRHDAVDDE